MDCSHSELQTRGLGISGIVGAVSVAFLWALCYPLITTTVGAAPPLVIAALRALFAGLTLLVPSFWFGRSQPRGWDWLVVAAIGVTWTGVGFAGMFSAGGRISPGVATVVANSQPLLAAVLGSFALDERLVPNQTIGIGIAFAGVGVVALPSLIRGSGSTATSIGGLVYVLLGALGVAVGNVLMKRYASRLDVVSTTGWQLIIGSAVLFAAVGVGRQAVSIHWTRDAVLAFVALFSLGTAVPFALWLALLKRAPLHSLNAFTFLTPPIALGIGVLFYGESLGLLEVVGTVLVVGGAWVAAGRLRNGGKRPKGS